MRGAARLHPYHPQLDQAWSTVPQTQFPFRPQRCGNQVPANDSSIGDGIMTGGFRFNASTPVRLNSNLARVDWNISSKMTAFFRVRHLLRPRWDHRTSRISGHSLACFVGAIPGEHWQATTGRSPAFGEQFSLWVDAAGFQPARDSNQNAIYLFRGVLLPIIQTGRRRAPRRSTTLWMILSGVKGSHTIKFGANVRAVKNNRTGFTNAFDSAALTFSLFRQLVRVTGP